MIRKMVNLRCAAGHGWLAVPAQVWEGRECGHTTRPDLVRSARCKLTLHKTQT